MWPSAIHHPVNISCPVFPLLFPFLSRVMCLPVSKFLPFPPNFRTIYQNWNKSEVPTNWTRGKLNDDELDVCMKKIITKEEETGTWQKRMIIRKKYKEICRTIILNITVSWAIWLLVLAWTVSCLGALRMYFCLQGFEALRQIHVRLGKFEEKEYP